MNDDESTSKKKGDKPEDNATSDVKKDKSDTEEPKPRIVLTFRSEKSNTKSANMKIVSTEEKHEEVSPRRSSRTRGKWDWVCDSDTSISPKKDKSQPPSENDESDSSQKRTRRRSRDDNIIASAIARKEKSYNEATPGPTRLSRRIKPTAKVLANEELRMGLESQNNARLGIQAEKSPEEGVRTRRSARPAVESEKTKPKADEEIPGDVVELDSDSQNSDMKVQHLCKLGLKAIDPEEVDTEKDEDKELEEDELLEDEEEIDDDSEVISKLLEADDDSSSSDPHEEKNLDQMDFEDDDDYICSVAKSKGPPRRSTRLRRNDSDRSSPVPDEDVRTSRRRKRRHSDEDSALDAESEEGRSVIRTRRRRRHSDEDAALEAECEDGSNPAGGDEGSEAACPADKSTIVAKCYCETPSNVYADSADLTEPVFCQAIETVEGVRVGCSHAARRAGGACGALLRAGPRAPFHLACALHARQLARHMCCPACGLYCSQGIFYQCSEGHFFHLECGLPDTEAKSKAGCPHCGVYSYRWQPANTACWKVKIEMKSTNKRIFLPDQREQCTQAYLSFSKLSPSQLNNEPVIPEDLLPPAKDLKRLCAKPAEVVKCTPQELCDAILAGESLDLLIPKILSGCKLNKRLSSLEGGAAVHAAARAGAVRALHALRAAGADLDLADHCGRAPLLLAVLALLDKSELKSKKKKADKSPDETEVELKEDPDSQEEASQEGVDSKAEEMRAKDEELLKVIRYLIAAGADVNLPDQPDSMTALHVAAQHGSREVCAALLDAPTVEVDARDHGGWTPLVWAAENDHHHVVRLLLEAGADPLSADKEGNSAAHWCAVAGAGAALQALLAHAPSAADRPNAHSDTPLHIAAQHGRYACVVILLARGARSDIENSEGSLAVDVAAGACQSAIALNMQMKLALQDRTPTRLCCSDISNGREPWPVPCVNEVDDEPAPADFTYVTQHVTPEPVAVDCTIQSLQGCECAGGACGAPGSACGCVALGVRGWWRGARLAHDFPYADPPMLFQCNATCRCNPKLCGNSVISQLSAQGSLFTRAEVFRCRGARGWGLRARALVPRGAPVALYCGELLPLPRADTRSDDSYMFALDVKPDLIEQCSDASPLCVDARRFGGAARFVNHSCAPNLAPVRAFTATRDLRLPVVALFATADVRPGDQFTFDYGDKFWSVKSKWMKCECGAPNCRYPTKTGDETEA